MAPATVAGRLTCRELNRLRSWERGRALSTLAGRRFPSPRFSPPKVASRAALDWEAPATLLTPWSPRPALRSTTEVWSAPVSTLTAAVAVPPTAPTLYLADWRLAVTGPAVAGTVSSPLLGPLAESMA